MTSGISSGFSAPELFRGKLAGMYGWGNDADVYAKLSEDKREALSLVARRLVEVNLWSAVGRIVNVYGVGGVGLYFSATRDLKSELNDREDFTRAFARHHDNTDGFLEKGRKHASLHFLYIDNQQDERKWHVHLDYYGPYGSLVTMAQHLFYERWRKFRPDWKLMKTVVE